MPKPLHLCKGGFPRRSCRSKAMPYQPRHQFAELLFLIRSQFQIIVSSVLAHRRFLSKGSNLPKCAPNLTSTRQIRQPSFRRASCLPEVVPAPRRLVPRDFVLPSRRELNILPAVYFAQGVRFV